MEHTQHTGELYSGIVWIISSITLALYGILTLTHHSVPGVEQLVGYLSRVDSNYIFVAACISIFIEALYVVGNFFPGATLIIILSILSQTKGPASFLITIAVIFLGWTLAGIVNILLARWYGVAILKRNYDAEHQAEYHIWSALYPAFRANYEVAQVIKGGKISHIVWASIKMKFAVSVVMLAVLALVPLFIDIRNISNEEGVGSIFAVALIMAVVGGIKMRKHFLNIPTSS